MCHAEQVIKREKLSNISGGKKEDVGKWETSAKRNFIPMCYITAYTMAITLGLYNIFPDYPYHNSPYYDIELDMFKINSQM